MDKRILWLYARHWLFRVAIALFVVAPITYGAVDSRGEPATVILFVLLNCVVTLVVAERSVDAVGIAMAVSLATVTSAAFAGGLGLPVALVLNIGLIGGMSYPFASLGVIRGRAFPIILQVGGMSYAANYAAADGHPSHVSVVALLLAVLLSFPFGFALLGVKRLPRVPLWLSVAVVVATFVYTASQAEHSVAARVNLILFVGLAIGTALGYAFERWIVPFVRAFARVAPYLRAMYRPVSGFVLVYLAVMFLFAGYYAFAFSVHWLGKFLGVPAHVGFWDFTYLSMTTIFPLGYSPIRPGSGPTEVIASLEAIVGTGLLVVVFAALVAYLTPRFEKVTERVLDEEALEIIRILQERVNSDDPDESASAKAILERARTLIVETSLSAEAQAHAGDSFPEWLAAIPQHDRRRTLRLFHDVIST